MSSYQFDIIVVGGGPAGVTAALRACELGAKVALVERANWEAHARMMGVSPAAFWPRQPGSFGMLTSLYTMG